MRIRVLATLLLAVVPAAAVDDRAAERARLMDEVAEQMARYAPGAGGAPALAPEVARAMRAVPRHAFVPDGLGTRAYENRPLPIGHGQTISQPFIVALMTQMLAIEPGDRVFELGTGSGYQAAVLAEMGATVYSMEIVPPLAEAAAERLERLGYAVSIRVGDGYHGWPEHAPFDAIIVTAAASQIPPPLVRQLKADGAMAIPVGAPFAVQQLVLVRADENGAVSTRAVLPVRFVPVTGDH